MSTLVLSFTSVMFLVIALTFHGIGWLTRDLQEDIRIRRGLDRLFDRLDRIPLRELAYRFLRQFQRRWESTFGKSRLGLLRFMALSFSINVLAVAGLILLSRQAKLILVLAPDEVEQRMLWKESSFALTLLLALASAAVGLVVDLIAKTGSSALLRFALRGTHILRLVLVCSLDAFLLVQLLRMFELPLHALAAACFQPIVNSPFFPTPSAILALVILIQLVGASFQTAVYFVLGCCTLAARLCPRALQQLLARCVYQITTDKKPVFGQLAGGFGALSGLFGALAGLTKLL